ncbi:MAG: CopY family transcriptional regulator [Planctomycetaceae bacterium]|nr:CopY family transcriptional regulator [Planctomycetaceae bacterium]
MDMGSQLSRRERQIMDVIFARGEASSAEIREDLPDAPTRGALRVMLRILEDKQCLTHSTRGREYIYKPTISRRRAGLPALQRVIDTFFGGSVRDAMAAHLSRQNNTISDEDLRHLAQLIREARRKDD